MKIPVPIVCSCGHKFDVPAYGGRELPPAVCPHCGENLYLYEPLTISVVADRLLLRSQHEQTQGDFTISIICAAMAVECALTALFLKWKEIALFEVEGRFPTQEEQEGLEREYKTGTSRGGFKNAADFVSRFVVGSSYDEFVGESMNSNQGPARLERRGATDVYVDSKHIQTELFSRRNRVLHLGQVGYTREAAAAALAAAISAVSTLKRIDRKKYLSAEIAPGS